MKPARNGFLCWVVAAVVGAFGSLLHGETTKTSVGPPCINVVLLDDGVPLRDAEKARDDWQAWERRVPTFLDNLQLVAAFRRATGETPDANASLYGLEIAPGVSADRKDQIIAAELERIFSATKRPSVVLARSSVGNDQMRIVFQDSRDYPPAHAAKFLRFLSEISPPVTCQAIAGTFGPFTAPPTMVFDPRASDDRGDRAKNRASEWR